MFFAPSPLPLDQSVPVRLAISCVGGEFPFPILGLPLGARCRVTGVAPFPTLPSPLGMYREFVDRKNLLAPLAALLDSVPIVDDGRNIPAKTAAVDAPLHGRAAKATVRIAIPGLRVPQIEVAL